MDVTIFQFSKSQVTKTSKLESCNFYPQNSFNFIRYHDGVLFIVDEESWIDCMKNLNSCNSGKGWTIWIE